TTLGTQDTPPLVIDIKNYDDRTILVHIIRNDSTQSAADCLKIRGISLEQKLRIRLIHLNGSVKEIDPNLNLHPVNYCLLNVENTDYKVNKLNKIVVYLKDTQKNNTNILHNIVNPISIYPLQKPFILVTYVNTTNTSDPKAYEEWGKIIDWNGNTR
ncbi:15475_t:CDS:1, partial [Racocetra persica]